MLIQKLGSNAYTPGTSPWFAYAVTCGNWARPLHFLQQPNSTCSVGGWRLHLRPLLQFSPEVNFPMIELLGFIRYIVHLYIYVVIAAVVLSWLLAFNVINYSNPFVKSLWQAVNAVTEPFLAPIRRMLPSMGGLDLSPIVLLIACTGIADFLIPFLQRTIG